MPNTLQPMMRAICPAVAPTGPAADDISTTFAGLGEADVAEREIAGQAGNGQDTGPGAEKRRIAGGSAAPHDRRSWLSGRSEATADEITDRKRGVARFDDTADCRPLHGLADLKAACIARSSAKPVAAAGIGGRIENLDKDPAVIQRWKLTRLDAKIVGHRQSRWTSRQDNMTGLH